MELTEQEEKEVAALNGAAIDSIEDVRKLQKFAAYFKSYGIHTTAMRCEQRLKELGTLASSDQVVDEGAIRRELAAALATMKSQPAAAASKCSGAEDVSARPPVRSSRLSGAPVAVAGQQLDQDAATLTRKSTVHQASKGSNGIQVLSSKQAVAGAKPSANSSTASKQQQSTKEHLQELVKANPHMSAADKTVASHTLREQGNDQYKLGAFDAALEYYNAALQLAPDNVKALSNRAQVHLKLRNPGGALSDLGVVLSREGDNVKALLRRAEAQIQLRDHAAAAQDVAQVLQLEPSNVDAQQKKKLLERLLGTNRQPSKPAQVPAVPSTSAGTAGAAAGTGGAVQTGDPTRVRLAVQVLEDETDSDDVEFEEVWCPPAADGSDGAGAAAGAGVANGTANGHTRQAVGNQQPVTKPLPEEQPTSSSSSSSSSDDQALTSSQPCTAAAPVQQLPTAATTRPAPPAADVGKQASGSSMLQGDHTAGPTVAEAAATAKRAAAHLTTKPAVAESAAAAKDTTAAQARAAPAVAEAAAVAKDTITAQARAAPAAAPAVAEAAAVAKDAAAGQEEDTGLGATPSAIQHLEQQVKELQAAGNLAFKQGSYQVSVGHYTAAIKLQPDNATMYNNRAMAHLKIQRWGPALDDSNKAAALEPDNYKAVYRRSSAKNGLGDLKGAVEDLEQCLQLAPAKSFNTLQTELATLCQQRADKLQAAAAEAKAQEEASTVHRLGGQFMLQELGPDPLEEEEKLYQEHQQKQAWQDRVAKKLRQLAEERLAAFAKEQGLPLSSADAAQLAAAKAAGPAAAAKPEGPADAAAAAVSGSASAAAACPKEPQPKQQVPAAPSSVAAAKQPAVAAGQPSAANDAPPAAATTAAGKSEPSRATRSQEAPVGEGAADQVLQLPDKLFDEPVAKAAPTSNAAAAPAAADVSKAGSTEQQQQQQQRNKQPPAVADKPPATATHQQVKAPPSTASASAGACAAAAAAGQQQAPQQLFQSLKQQGAHHFQAGDFTAAESCWQQCLELDPDNAPVLNNLCYLYIKMAEQQQQGSPQRRNRALAALRAGDQVLAQPGLSVDLSIKATYRRCLACELLEDYEAAIQGLTDLLERHPDQPNFPAVLQRVSSKFQEARRAAAAAAASTSSSTAAVVPPRTTSSASGPEAAPAASRAAVAAQDAASPAANGPLSTHATGSKQQQQQQQQSQQDAPDHAGQTSSRPSAAGTASSRPSAQPARQSVSSTRHRMAVVVDDDDSDADDEQQQLPTVAADVRTTCAAAASSAKVQPAAQQQQEEQNQAAQLEPAHTKAAPVDGSRHEQALSDMGRLNGVSGRQSVEATASAAAPPAAQKQQQPGNKGAAKAAKQPVAQARQEQQQQGGRAASWEALKAALGEVSVPPAVAEAVKQLQQQADQVEAKQKAAVDAAISRFMTENAQQLIAQVGTLKDWGAPVRKQKEALERQLSQGRRRQEAQAQELVQCASECLAKGQLARAVRDLKEARAKDPLLGQAAEFEGQAHLRLKNWQQALDALNDAVAFRLQSQRMSELRSGTLGQQLPADKKRVVMQLASTEVQQTLQMVQQRLTALRELHMHREALKDIKVLLLAHPGDTDLQRQQEEVKAAYQQQLRETLAARQARSSSSSSSAAGAAAPTANGTGVVAKATAASQGDSCSTGSGGQRSGDSAPSRVVGLKVRQLQVEDTDDSDSSDFEGESDRPNARNVMLGR